MPANAALLGDPITGVCPVHMIIGPLGVPTPSPLPFNAPVTLGCSLMTTINGRPIALVGATGINTPPHIGLHAVDPVFAPPLQIGSIVASLSPLVLVEGRPIATTGSSCTMCNQIPGSLVGSSDVLVG
jgi:uncharacterized Zn-binding protein involved in type VI secretion